MSTWLSAPVYARVGPTCPNGIVACFPSFVYKLVTTGHVIPLKCVTLVPVFPTLYVACYNV